MLHMIQNRKGLFRRPCSGHLEIILGVIIAIIGVLATLLLLQLGTARAKARDAKRITDINGLRTAIEIYYDDNGGKYPTAVSDALLGKYISSGKVPTDPVTAVGYPYAYNTGGGSNPVKYHLWTELETKNTAALAGDGDMNSTGWTGSPYDASNAATTEVCTAAYAAGAARDCIYDTGQQ